MSDANKRAQIAYLQSLVVKRGNALEAALSCLRHAHDRLIEYPELETLRLTITGECRAIRSALSSEDQA